MIAGDPARLTGGNLYDRRMLAALRSADISVATVVLRDRSDAARLSEVRAPVVLVDTIAAALATGHLAGLSARGSLVVALVHMRSGAMALARRADRVIAVSRWLAGELIAAGVDRKRVAVISPGRDGVRPGRRDRGGSAVLCVANWTPTKGIHTLVAAAARVPGLHLDLVGDAPDAAYAARVRGAMATARLATRVGVRGPLRGAALARRYREAGVFALPSTREAYPIAFAEALANGLPVIGCDIPGVREVTGDAAILVPPGRVAPLAAALERLLTDERLRRSLARRSLLRARQLPTWGQSEARFVRAIRRWIAAAQPR